MRNARHSAKLIFISKQDNCAKQITQALKTSHKLITLLACVCNYMCSTKTQYELHVHICVYT